MNVAQLIEDLRKTKTGILSRDNPVGVRSVFPKAMEVVPNGNQPDEIVSFANTPGVDLDREVVVPEGGNVTDYFGKNRNLFVDHRYDTLSCVAKCRNLELKLGRGWLCRGALIKNPENPMIQAVRALAVAGALGMSIGFEALDYGPPTAEEAKAYKGARSIVRSWRLLEISYTPMPMNVECQTLEHSFDDTKAATARTVLHKAGVRSDVLKAMGLMQRKVFVFI